MARQAMPLVAVSTSSVDAVRADVDHALLVDLQAFVEGAHPARAHPAPGEVAGVEAPGELQRERTGERGIDLVDVHPTRGHVDGLATTTAGVLRASLGAGTPHLVAAPPMRVGVAATAAATGARVRQALTALVVEDLLQVLGVLDVDVAGVLGHLLQVVAGFAVEAPECLACVLGQGLARFLRAVFQGFDDLVAHSKLTPAILDWNVCAWPAHRLGVVVHRAGVGFEGVRVDPETAAAPTARHPRGRLGRLEHQPCHRPGDGRDQRVDGGLDHLADHVLHQLLLQVVDQAFRGLLKEDDRGFRSTEGGDSRSLVGGERGGQDDEFADHSTFMPTMTSAAMSRASATTWQACTSSFRCESASAAHLASNAS